MALSIMERGSSFSYSRDIESALHDAEIEAGGADISDLNAQIYIAMLSDSPEQAAVLEKMIDANVPGTEGLLLNLAKQKAESYRYRALRNPDPNVPSSERRVMAVVEDWSQNLNHNYTPNQWMSQTVTGQHLDHLIDSLPERKPELYFKDLTERVQKIFSEQGKHVSTAKLEYPDSEIVQLFRNFFYGSAIEARRYVTCGEEIDLKEISIPGLSVINIEASRAAIRAKARATATFESELSDESNRSIIRALMSSELSVEELAQFSSRDAGEVQADLDSLINVGVVSQIDLLERPPVFMLTAKARFEAPNEFRPTPVGQMKSGDYPTDVILPSRMIGDEPSSISFNQAIDAVVALNPFDPDVAHLPRKQAEELSRTAFELLRKLETDGFLNGQKYLEQRNDLCFARSALQRSMDVDAVKRNMRRESHRIAR